MSLENKILVKKEDIQKEYDVEKVAKTVINFLSDVLPVRLCDRKTEILHILGLYLVNSGTMYYGPKKGKLHAMISKPSDDDSFLEFIDLCSSQLGIGFRVGPSENSYVLGKNARPYIRVLSKMGFVPTPYDSSSSRSTRTVHGYTVPDYIQQIIHDYSSLPSYEKIHLRKYVSDYVNNMINTRVSLTKDKRCNVFLHSQPNEKLVLDEAKTFILAHNILYPKPQSCLSMSRDFSKYSQMSSERRFYRGVINIPFDCIMSYSDSALRPLGVQITKKAMYSYKFRNIQK